MRIGHRTRRYMTEKKPEGNFREMSLHPTEQDLKAIVNLRVNKVKGGKTICNCQKFWNNFPIINA